MDELHTLLSRAGVPGPYLLVGHSYGGLLASLYTHQHPDEVAGMVLVDGAHEEMFARTPESVRESMEDVFASAKKTMRVIKPLNSLGLLALLKLIFPTKFPGDPNLPPSMHETHMALVLSDNRNLETGLEEVPSIDASLAQVCAAKISSYGDIPLIVLSAGARPDHDPASGISAEEMQQTYSAVEQMQVELTARSSRGKQIVAPESGHYIHVEQPELVVEAIREVVDMIRMN